MGSVQSIQDDYQRFEGELSAAWPAALGERRRKAIDHFGEIGFPSKRAEQWRFINLNPITQTSFRLPQIFNGFGAQELEPRYGGR